MDPITTAIVAAAVAGATTGGGEVVQKGIVDAYSALKKLITDKFGADGDVADALAKVEKTPEAPHRQTSLAGELATVGASKDPEIEAAADALLEKLGQTPQGKAAINQVAIGHHIAQAAGGGAATVTHTVPDRAEVPDPKK